MGMNIVIVSGRLTKDPDFYNKDGNCAVAKFTVAVDRGDKNHNTDFPRITVFGKPAENAGKYLIKGSLVTVEGRLQTGSYVNRDGDTVYTNDVIGSKVDYVTGYKRKDGTIVGTGNARPASENKRHAEPDPGYEEAASYDRTASSRKSSDISTEELFTETSGASERSSGEPPEYETYRQYGSSAAASASGDDIPDEEDW